MNGDGERFPSGAWTGYYQQLGARWRQDLDLTFANGAMHGSGADPVGRFTVRGTYDGASGEVVWRKTYAHGNAPVHYRGFREGKGIWGTWEIAARERSGFHIWPRTAGVADAAMAAEAAWTAAPAPAHTPAPAPARALERAPAH